MVGGKEVQDCRREAEHKGYLHHLLNALRNILVRCAQPRSTVESKMSAVENK